MPIRASLNTGGRRATPAGLCADLETLRDEGAWEIALQEGAGANREAGIQRFLTRNPGWERRAADGRPPELATAYLIDTTRMSMTVDAVRVPIGKLGPLGKGERSIDRKVVTVGDCVDLATGAVWEDRNFHNIASAFNPVVVGAERTRRRSAYSKVAAAALDVTGPAVVGGDANGGEDRYTAHVPAGFRWAKTGPTHGTRRIDLVGATADVRINRAWTVETRSDHRGVLIDFTPPPAPTKEPEMALTNLADVCRSAGLKVVEVDGWKTRGRSGSFKPVGVLCHHTATSKRTSDAATVNLLVRGRSDLPGPLCQLGLARDGTVYVIAAGRANHAGKAKASGTVAAGDGNSLYVGIEAFNDGVGEPWPAAQYAAYAKLCAALCSQVTGNSVQTVRGHKETSVTGKIDPRFDMAAFREDVAELLDVAPPRVTPPNHPGALYDALLAALNTYEARIDKGRPAARAWAAAVRKAVLAGKRFTAPSKASK